MGIRAASAALALAGMMSGGQALADVQGLATLGNLRVTLFDLDLSDSVTPSITLSLPSETGASYNLGALSVSYIADSYHFSETYNKYVRVSPGAPETLSYRHGQHAELSTQYVHPTALGQTLSVSSRLGPAGQHEFSLWGAVYGDTLGIVLTPNTRAVFSADLAFAGTTSSLSTHKQELLLQASLLVNDLQLSEYVHDFSNMRIGSFEGDQPAVDDSDILSVTFSNGRDGERAGELRLSLSLNAGLSPLAPVPEPASAAMLLAGAVLLGLHQRRRGRKSRSQDRRAAGNAVLGEEAMP